MAEYAIGSANKAAVKHIQMLLNAKGAQLAEDGAFGPITDQEVRIFQAVNLLVIDGIVGPVTLAALKNPHSLPVTTPIHDAHAAIDSADVLFQPVARGSQPADTAQWQAWRDAALQITGQYNGNIQDKQSALDIIASHESGFIPNAINNYDLNNVGPIVSDGFRQKCSRGLMQTIFTTFARFHAAGTSDNIYEPIAGISAAIYYSLAVYGSIDNVPGVMAVRNGAGYVGY